MIQEYKNQKTKAEETSKQTRKENEASNPECEECDGLMRKNESNGEWVCEDCGLVSEGNAIDRGPEWRSFNDSSGQKSRVGAPTTNLIHDKGLSTNIGWQNKDKSGKTLSKNKRRRMNRLRTWNERFRTKDSKERNLKQALGEIQRMSSSLGLNKQVEETASMIYRQCLEKNLLPGRSIEGVATASLYAAARQCNTPRSLDEMYPVSRISKTSEIDRTYRYIAKELGLKMEPVDPRQYLPRFISQLEVSNPEDVRHVAEEMLSAGEDANIHSGKSPTGLAAAAIYCGCLLNNEGKTQKNIARVSDVSEVTIRNRYKELLDAHPKFEME